MPALCRVAASAPGVPAAEPDGISRSPGKFHVAIIAVAGFVVLTLTAGAFGSAWALRAKSANMQEAVATANVGPRSNRGELQPRATNGMVAPQSKPSVERIVQPREVVEAIPAQVDAGQEVNATIPSPADPEIAAKACAGPQQATATLGTTLEFAGSPSDALKQAVKEHKLVFLLHISGNFEESGFT
jgi:hypothetical protein